MDLRKPGSCKVCVKSSFGAFPRTDWDFYSGDHMSNCPGREKRVVRKLKKNAKVTSTAKQVLVNCERLIVASQGEYGYTF